MIEIIAFSFSFLQILRIDLSVHSSEHAASRQVGSIIRIKVTDDFKVAKVQVKITNPDGSLVEVGDAVTEKDNELYWLYTAIKLNESPVGDKITVTALDTPGNNTIEEKAL